MKTARPFLIYLHGFNSSPQSRKARCLGEYLARHDLAKDYACPKLPPAGSEAIGVVETEMSRHPGRCFVFVGSSLGGFYATWLAERHDAKAVLLNPGIRPHIDLRAYLGMQQNLYTGEQYCLTARHLEEWERLYCAQRTSSRYLLLVETADEVLDYHEAVACYAGARQIVVSGGDHSLQSFASHIPVILQFAGLSSG